MKNLRIGLVADIHAGTTRSNIKSGEALSLLRAVVRQCNQQRVDMFVTLGDNVNATNPEEDLRYLRQVRDVLDEVTGPVVPLLGNNEAKFLSFEHAAQALKCSPETEVRKINGWSLVFWRPNCALNMEDGLRLNNEDLASLQDALDEASYPVVVFCHAPIDNHSMVGNYYFERRTNVASYMNAAAARSILQRSDKVVFVIAGHVHWNSGSKIDGIHYRTIPSLTDTFQENGEASKSWAVLSLDPDRIGLDVFGSESMTWSAPPRAQDLHWRVPLSQDGFDDRMIAMWEGKEASA